MTKSNRKALETLFYAVARKCESMREWDEMLRVTEQAEKQHRRGYVVRNARTVPVSVAVKYFACSYVLEGRAVPTSWASLTGMRPDLILGQGLRERAGDLSSLESVWKDLALDYSEDIV